VIHYTLNTGHTVEHTRDLVRGDVLAMLDPLVRSKGGNLPGPFGAFRVEIVAGNGGVVFSVLRARDPIVTCGLAWTPEGEQELWPEIESLYLDVSDRYPAEMQPLQEPVMPAKLPWLAVVMLPAMTITAKLDISWLGDFERCLAFAILHALAPRHP
jgi:hypothetical protein